MDEPKDQRILLHTQKSLLEEIDDWAFENRIRSRSEAIRQLIKLGLESERARQPTDGE